MNTETVAQGPPDPTLLPLDALTIEEANLLSTAMLPEELSPEHVAPRFFQRIHWHRSSEQFADWISPRSIAERLHTVRELLRHRADVVEADDDCAVSQEEWDDLIDELLEYLSIRIELAAEPDSTRMRRYMVKVGGA